MDIIKNNKTLLKPLRVVFLCLCQGIMSEKTEVQSVALGMKF